jgi:hypothetical protein
MIIRYAQAHPNENATFLRLVAILLMLIFSGGSQIAAAADFDECGIESTVAFEDWRGWNKTTPTPYLSGEHRSWATIYFDELAAKSSQSADGQFLPCAKIVKVHFADASGTAIRKLFLMAKMPAGFDPNHGDWWYGNYDASIGAGMIEQGAVEGCISCHQRASDLDYVFFKEQIEKSME